MLNKTSKNIAVSLLCAGTFLFNSGISTARELMAKSDLAPATFDREYESTENSPFLSWLESLLTQVSVDDYVDDGEAEKMKAEFEEAISKAKASQAPDSEPMQDGAFRKPADIPALYTSPALEGEGIWSAENVPASYLDGKPLAYKTVYRPSVEFPNSIVYMTVFDMKKVKPKLFIGQTEPGIYNISNISETEDLSKIVAITNAMWMQQHSRGAGAIFRGQAVYPMVPGMATMVVYKDDSVDVLEWSDDIPTHLVKDARQLRHLIVKDGTVVEQVLKGGKLSDSEIGLGGFLIDDKGRSTMGNKFWFLANRTAFGIRADGNLVFAMGHHVSTKDLAKALILAGCKRAIHGDANIHNIVCNFYFRNEANKIVKRERLSPEQLTYTMKRYDQGYMKDFFAFYEK